MRRKARVVLRGLGGAALLWGATASAQYRAPPATEAQRLTYQGDDYRAEAAKALGEGDKGELQSLCRKAVEHYEKALAQNPQELGAAEGLGFCGTALGEHEKVVKVLGPLAQAFEENRELAYHLGIALFKLKRYDDAVVQLEKLRDDQDPAHLLGHYYLGYYYASAQRGEQAVASLQHYLRLRPQSLAANDYQIYELLGRGYLAAQKPKEARSAFQKAQAGRPESLSIQMGLEAVLEMEGRLPEARALLERLARVFPASPEPRERLGRVLLSQGDFARADGVVRDLLKIDAGANAQYLLGDVRLAQKRFPEAEAALRKAQQGLSHSLAVQVSLARALQGQGKNEEAIKLFEAATRGGVSTVEAWAALGSVYRRAGRYQKAVEAHEKVVALAPTIAYGRILLGADYYVTGQWDQAIERYTEALKVEPRHPVASHWLANALTQRARARAEAGRLIDAVRDLRRAFDLQPSVLVGKNLGAALLSLKEFAEARGVLDRVTKLKGAGWEEHLLLGYAQLGAGDYAQAVQSFDEAGKFAQAPEAVAQVYAGWAMAKLEMGEFDTAVQKLLDMANTGSAARTTQANLPFALLRRALGHLEQGNVAAAEKDVQAVRKLGSKDADAQRLLSLATALLSVEQREYAAAQRELRRATTGRLTWADGAAPGLLEAYVAYRSGEEARARKLLAMSRRRAGADAAAWAATLARAVDRRDGELAYARGAIGPATRALKAAAEDDPLNPYVQHNLACLDHRAKRYAPALDKWASLTSAVPEAWLNLGIDAHELKRNYGKAYEYYGRYLDTATGGRTSQVKDWRERLAAIHGLEDGPKADAPAPKTVEVQP